MPKKHRAAAALIAALLTTSGDCTPLVVGCSGNHIIVATNSIDTDGNSRCKLHFSKSAVVMRATQAVSMTLKWPNGRTETIDFDAAINDRIRDLDQPIGRLQEILVQDVQERIRAILQLYKPEDPDRADIARDLVSEYVIVGREHNGFLGVRAFTLQIVDPQSITFEVRDITVKLRNDEVIDYTQGEINTINAHGYKAVRAAIYARLQSHNEVAQSLGNKAFAPPYLVMDVTHSRRSYLSDPGPCGI
jgi:hypothetical protein